MRAIQVIISSAILWSAGASLAASKVKTTVPEKTDKFGSLGDYTGGPKINPEDLKKIKVDENKTKKNGSLFFYF